MPSVGVLLIGLIAIAALGLGVLTRKLDPWRLTLAGLLICLALAGSHVAVLSALAFYGRVALAALLIVVCLTRPAHQLKLARTRQIIAALAVCAVVGGVSTLWSFDPGGTALYTVFFALLLINLYLAVTRRWTDTAMLAGDLRAVFVTVAVFITAGVAAWLVGMENAVGFADRVRGLFQNANMLGAVSAIIAPLGWALALYYRRWWYLAATGPVVVAAVVSGSRTAILALAIAAVWFLILAPFMVKFFAFWAAGFAAGVWGLLYGFGAVQAPDLRGGVFERLAQADDQETLNGRVEVWTFAADTARETGVGVGFGAAPEYLTTYLPFLALDSVHNSYLQWVMETGFVGILPLAALLGLVVARLFSRTRTLLSVGLGAVIVSGLILQTTESMMFGMGQVHPWMYWLVAVAASAAVDLRSVETREAELAELEEPIAV